MGNTYIAHVTTNTGHSRQSHRSEIADNVVGVVSKWLTDMLAGTTRAIYQDKYACRLERESNKSALFIISRVDDTLSHTDIVKFSVCIHTHDKRRAWTEVNGTGNPHVYRFVRCICWKKTLRQKICFTCPCWRILKERWLGFGKNIRTSGPKPTHSRRIRAGIVSCEMGE